MSGARANLRKLVVIVTAVWPKSCPAQQIVLICTVEESLLRKKMS